MRTNEKGQGLVEYALVLVLVAVVVIVILALLSGGTNKQYAQYKQSQIDAQVQACIDSGKYSRDECIRLNSGNVSK